MIMDTIKSTIPTGIKNVGIKMSGGADSSVTAYVIARYSKENNLDLNIIPITVVEAAAPFQLQFTTHVVSIINKLLEVDIQQPLVYNYTNGVKTQLLREIEKELFDNNIVDLIVSGTTKIPGVDIGCPQKEGMFSYDRTLDVYPYVWDNQIYTPVLNLDKKGIAEIYTHYNLMDTLFPHTRSCVLETTDFSKHCGSCWWCAERIWAFGKLE
jgi:hypothetical protein